MSKRKWEIVGFTPARAVLVLMGLLTALSGCGLSDYEKRIDKQAEFLKNFDQQIKALGPPLDIPRSGSANPTTQLALINVYFRPPKFIQSQYLGEKAGPYGKWETLYRYPGKEGHEGFNLFIGGESGRKPLPPEQGEEQPKVEEKTGDFSSQVKDALSAFHEKEYQEPLAIPPEQNPKTLRLTVLQPGQSNRPELEYEVISVDGGKKDKPLRFFLYFTKRKGASGEPAPNKVAIIIQMPVQEAKNTEIQQVIESSLRTLEVGSTAEKLRIAFAKANKK